MYLSLFFQAEDGIRDWSVTGVQTCALPIYHPAVQRHGRAEEGRELRHGAVGVRGSAGGRSEEGRVGKEWRSRWSPYHLKKEKQPSRAKIVAQAAAVRARERPHVSRGLELIV